MTSLVANTAEATTTLVAEVVLTTTVEDGYRQTAEIRKYHEGYEIHIRESFEDGSASNVYLRGGHFTKLVDFAAEHGIRCNSFDALTEANKKLKALVEEGRRAIGDHFAPNDCYATGPLTGDPIRDLVRCPACSFVAMYDDALKSPGAK